MQISYPQKSQFFDSRISPKFFRVRHRPHGRRRSNASVCSSPHNQALYTPPAYILEQNIQNYDGNVRLCNCTGLKSAVLPDGITSIGDSWFQNCTGLTDVSMADSVTVIGKAEAGASAFKVGARGGTASE
ncbi:MAG: leucine-rich repeat protein [Oscillospiraceae bacterium]|nr:leucine-rich repeat protein [Oscillospiraceae bacterium]